MSDYVRNNIYSRLVPTCTLEEVCLFMAIVHSHVYFQDDFTFGYQFSDAL